MRRFFLLFFLFCVFYLTLGLISVARAEIIPLRGWAWSSYGSPASGLGWVRLSWDTPDGLGLYDDLNKCPDPEQCKYGVYFDEVTGKLSGYAWSGLKDTGEGVLYGWLSFNESDLVGCPNSNCLAKILGGGKLSGWARFLAQDPEKSDWTGWVSLRDEAKDYGVCYGDIADTNGNIALNGTGKYCKGNGSLNNMLSGWAWGGDIITGWLRFGEQLYAPKITSTNTCIDPIAKKEQITVSWTPGQDYSSFIVKRNGIGIGPNNGEFGPQIKSESQSYEDNDNGIGLNTGTEYTYGFEHKAQALMGELKGYNEVKIKAKACIDEPPPPGECKITGVALNPAKIAVPAGSQDMIEYITTVYFTDCKDGEVKIGDIQPQLPNNWSISGAGGTITVSGQPQIIDSNKIIYKANYKAPDKTGKDIIRFAATYKTVTKENSAEVELTESSIKITNISCPQISPPADKSTTSLSWKDEIIPTHNVYVQRKYGIEFKDVEPGVSQLSPYNQEVNVVSPESVYYYRIAVEYPDKTRIYSNSVGVSCKVLIDKPEITGVIASHKTKDGKPDKHFMKIEFRHIPKQQGTVQEYQLSRLQATPNSITEFKVTDRQNFQLGWKNSTDFAQYFHIIESKIGEGNNFSPVYTTDSVLNPQGTQVFAWSPTGLAEATTYYYQIKSCGYIECLKDKVLYQDYECNTFNKNCSNGLADYFMCPTKPGADTNPKPNKACTDYSKPVSLTTWPNKPTGLTATPKSGSQIDFYWTDNSSKEDGYEVLRNGIDITPSIKNFLKSKLLSPDEPPPANKPYSDTGLKPDTEYTYTVKYYKYDVEERAKEKVYSSASISARTYFRVKWQTGGSGNGSITSQLDAACTAATCLSSCGSDCYEIKQGEGRKIKFSAKSSGSCSYFYGWSGGGCSGTDDCEVSSGNSMVTATFYKPSANVVISITPENSGTVSGSGVHSCGSTVELSASPADNYQFVSWSGDACSGFTATPCQFTMGASERNITANFQEIPSEPESFVKPSKFYAALISGLRKTAGQFEKLGKIVLQKQETITLNSKKITDKTIDKAVQTNIPYANVSEQAFNLFNKAKQTFLSIFTPRAIAETASFENFFKLKASISQFSGEKKVEKMTYEDIGLESATVYIYRVQAKYTDGSVSEWSNYMAGLTGTLPLSPLPPNLEPTAKIWAEPALVECRGKVKVSWITENTGEELNGVVELQDKTGLRIVGVSGNKEYTNLNISETLSFKIKANNYYGTAEAGISVYVNCGGDPPQEKFVNDCSNDNICVSKKVAYQGAEPSDKCTLAPSDSCKVNPPPCVPMSIKVKSCAQNSMCVQTDGFDWTNCGIDQKDESTCAVNNDCRSGGDDEPPKGVGTYKRGAEEK